MTQLYNTIQNNMLYLKTLVRWYILKSHAQISIVTLSTRIKFEQTENGETPSNLTFTRAIHYVPPSYCIYSSKIKLVMLVHIHTNLVCLIFFFFCTIQT